MSLPREGGVAVRRGPREVISVHIETHRPRDMSAPKPLKISLPMDLHLKLHAMRLLRGRSISEVVAEAVRAHLATIEAPGRDALVELVHGGADADGVMSTGSSAR